MRKRWIQVNGELIPADKYTAKSEGKLHIIPDIEPYKAVTGDMAGKWITSRKQHRDFLKRNDLVEVGNEKAYFTRHGGMAPDNPNLVNDRKHEERICQSLIQNLQKLRR